jgi:predicted P-loop ATPase
MNVTQYKDGSKSVKTFSLSELVDTMKDRASGRAVEEFREKLEECPPGCPCPAASKLPRIVFGAEYRKKNGEMKMAAYNGLVLLEVGNLSGYTEATEVRRKAAGSLQTLLAFIGSSRKSVKIVVPFTLPDGSLPRNCELAGWFHAHAYRMAYHYYRMQLQRNIAFRQPVIELSCRISYDPDLYYNPAAVPATLEQPLQMPGEPTFRDVKQQEPLPLQRMEAGRERSGSVYLLYQVALKKAIEEVGEKPDDTTADTLLVRLAENCLRAGIPEEDVVKWSYANTHFKRNETELRAAVHNAYLLDKYYGVGPAMPACQNLVLRMEEFMKRRYELRRNELKGEVEYRERRSYYYDFFPVTEEVLNTISLHAQAEGIDLWDRDVKRYIYSNKIPLFNPLDDYLDHLPEWDGKDHIRALADTVPTSSKLWRNHFYRWFLGLVAQWKQMSSVYANSVLPLLVGEQGCGKSTWCRNLLPPVLRDFYTDSIDFGNRRDAELMLHRFALINIDEFDSVGASRQSFLKHLLQKPEVNARKPYKSSVRALKRYAGFVGTCNNMDLLSDPTGSRRFLCVEIKGEIDRRYLVDHDQLYAQAIYLLRAGERYWFTHEEELAVTRQNEAFEQVPVEEQLLLQYFRAVPVGEDGGDWLSVAEIMQHIRKRSRLSFSNTTINGFGRLLRRNNYPSRHALRGNLYHVEEIG